MLKTDFSLFIYLIFWCLTGTISYNMVNSIPGNELASQQNQWVLMLTGPFFLSAAISVELFIFENFLNIKNKYFAALIFICIFPIVILPMSLGAINPIFEPWWGLVLFFLTSFQNIFLKNQYKLALKTTRPGDF